MPSPAATTAAVHRFLRRTSARVAMSLLLVTPVVGLAPPTASAARQVCGPSAGETVCLAAPDGKLSGTVTITATRSNATAGGTMEFYLNGAYLNFEYQRPYQFVWPTNKELDGTYTLAARLKKGSTYGAYVSESVVLGNGNVTSVPKNPANWAQLFHPQAGTVLAGVGNLGAQKPDELTLEKYVESTRPAIFAYLGEVHEFGTWATTLDHYGLANVDDPAKVGTEWGRMASYTLPTPGNHQRDYIPEYQDYWHQRPLWTTTTLDGVRIYDLTSECQNNGGCDAGGAQQKWLASQLAANSERCILSMWHRPLMSMDFKRSSPRLATAWQMIAQHGGDLVLTADTRDMEEAKPMNASLQTGKADSHMVELVSGAGAARWVRDYAADSRVAWNLYQVPGAVWINRTVDAHGASSLHWEFRDSSGKVLRTGSVVC